MNRISNITPIVQMQQLNPKSKKKQLVSNSYYLSDQTLKKVDENHRAKNIKISNIYYDDKNIEPVKVYLCSFRDNSYIYKDSRISDGFFLFEKNQNRKALQLFDFYYKENFNHRKRLNLQAKYELMSQLKAGSYYI